MIINFVGNFKSGYVGEVADQTHLAREIRALGHTVREIPQDEWREYVIEKHPVKKYPNIPINMVADINIITKWHHFYDGSFISDLRSLSGNAPVLYWVWDYMDDNGIPDWHIRMVQESDLYLSNDVRNGKYTKGKSYYFPFDVSDRIYDRTVGVHKIYDVVFFGSHLGQGDRIRYLENIRKYINPVIFSWNWQEWKNKGFDSHPPVYGDEFAYKVCQSKIILGFSVFPGCWGYWSNRVGKVLTSGGFLLQQYAPGMELFLRDGCEYFSDVYELREKIDYYLIADTERELIAERGYKIGRESFTSQARIRQLMILIERYLRKDTTWLT